MAGTRLDIGPSYVCVCYVMAVETGHVRSILIMMEKGAAYVAEGPRGQATGSLLV